MSEKKIVEAESTKENIAEDNLDKLAGAGDPWDGWRCTNCGKTFYCLPFDSRCPDCGGFVGTN